MANDPSPQEAESTHTLAIGGKYSSSRWQQHQDIPTEESILFTPSRWHKEHLPRPRTMFRAPHYLPHDLSNEGNDRCENHASVNEKFVSGLFGAIRHLCRQEDKGGTGREEEWWIGIERTGKEEGGTG